MKKAKNYEGGDLLGHWLFTLKIDGVRMLRDEDGNPVSRAGKPLHNLQNIPSYIVDAEIYLGSWEETTSAVRKHNGEPVHESFAYSLDPIDDRLILGNRIDPTEDLINAYLKLVNNVGHEGLVLFGPDGKVLKVKPVETYDLVIQDIIEGKGKRAGCVGKIVTQMGNVGIFRGFTEQKLREMWEDRENLIGTIGEFECMQLTPAKKMRHGKLLRIRFDKTTESKPCQTEI